MLETNVLEGRDKATFTSTAPWDLAAHKILLPMVPTACAMSPQSTGCSREHKKIKSSIKTFDGRQHDKLVKGLPPEEDNQYWL